jgi:hypothetical protein
MWADRSEMRAGQSEPGTVYSEIWAARFEIQAGRFDDWAGLPVRRASYSFAYQKG